MDVRYTKMSLPPQTAIKRIDFGALKGKSDINPQWKIEAMTEQFGLCGVGWKFEIADKITVPLESGEVMLYMSVAVSVKENGEWSAPAYGYGGDFIVKKNKNGLVPNDEAYKMCLTDALGNALKCFGVAADVYLGLYETKYAKQQSEDFEKPADVVKMCNDNVRLVNGRQIQVKSQNGAWYDVEKLSDTQLISLKDKEGYRPALEAIEATLASRSVG